MARKTKAEKAAEAEAVEEAVEVEDAVVEQTSAYGDDNTRVTDRGVEDPDPQV